MISLPEKITDFHVHLFPDDLFEAIWNYFKRSYGLDVVHKLYARESIDYLKSRGVGTVIYSNYAHKRGIARDLNDWNSDLLDRTQDVYCFAPFHPDDNDTLAMARDILSHPKVLGFKLHFMVQRFLPQDERLFPLYELVMERSKRLLLHVGTGPIGNNFTGIESLRNVLERYPDLPANIAHLGAFEFNDFFNILHGYAGIYLDTSYCFLPGNFRMYKLGNELLETHKTRLLYGSDFPNLFHDRHEEISALMGLNLSQKFYDMVFRDNAKSLLNAII